MGPHCSCGALLPADARFCHKCGKPQFDYPGFEPEEVAPEPAPAPVAAPVVAASPPAEINFHNRNAVHVALITGILSTVLVSLPVPVPGLWPLFSLVLGGLFAVYWYTRRTGVRLSLIAGARMGWLTGIFSFAIVAVLFTLVVVYIMNNGGFADFYRQNLKGMVTNAAELEQMARDLERPGTLVSVLLASMGMLFVLFTTFPMLGGALGAKLFARDDS